MPIFNTEYKSYWEWKPGANTIAYYPLNGDTNDYSGNNRNLTNYGATFNTTISSGESVAYFANSASAVITEQNISLSEGTLNIWLKKTRNAQYESFASLGASSSVGHDGVWEIIPNNTTEGNMGVSAYYDQYYYLGYNNTGINNNTWMNVVLTYNSGGNKMYINGNEVSITYSQGNASATLGTKTFDVICMGRHPIQNAEYVQGYCSRYIIEDKARTAQEVADYYNQTKSNYGL